MLLKITLDPSLDEEGYQKCGVVPHVIYAEVSSCNSTPSTDRYELKQCSILAEGMLSIPDRAILSVYKASATFYCEWEDEDSTTEIVLTVKVEECDRFPQLRNGG